jgi:hypothetical protein
MSELWSTNGSEAVQADGLGSGPLLEPEEAWAGMNEQARKRTTTIISGKEKADVVRTIAVSENAVRDREIVFGKTHKVSRLRACSSAVGKKQSYLDPAWSLLKHSPHEVGDQSEERDQESRNPDQESGG